MASSHIVPQMSFLTDAAHLLSLAAPETSAFLMRKRNSLLVDNHLPIPDSHRHRACSSCGRILIPGQASTTMHFQTPKAVRAPTRKPTKSSSASRPVSPEKRSRHGVSKVLTCGSCGSFTKLRIPGPGPILRNKGTAPTKPSVNISNKKRIKTRRAGLQALLDQRQNSAVSSAFVFGLSDFMKK